MSRPAVTDPAPGSGTWYSSDTPQPPRPRGLDWLRAIVRGVPLVLVLLAGLVLTLVARPMERLAFGAARPITGWITVAVCRAALICLGLRVRRHGVIAGAAQVLVANHASWLDILVLNACGPVYFVSKSEVAGWAGIGWLARATGTVFIRRTRTEARAHIREIADRIAAGHRLLLFPEGTSSDGARVLPFKPTLFEAFAAQPGLVIQPAAVRYHAPAPRDPRFYGWWGDMSFGPHALAMLAQSPHGHVDVVFLPSHTIDHATRRKDLAARLEKAVRAGFDAG